MSTTAQVLDGKALAARIVADCAAKAAELKPTLAVILVGDDPASQVYVRNKEAACGRAGIRSVAVKLPATTTQSELLAKVAELNTDAEIDGCIVQLPLPPQINAPEVIKAIDPHKDVDGFTAYNIGKMFLSKEFEQLPPATPSGIIRLLDEYNIDVAGKEVVVVGRSNIVGKPVAAMLLNRSATVTVCHSRTADLAAHTRRADILVVAVGRAEMITGAMVKAGVVVIDAGINSTDNGLVGDVNFAEVSAKASFITPVPGGVGPMTVAILIANTLRAAELYRSERV